MQHTSSQRHKVLPSLCIPKVRPLTNTSGYTGLEAGKTAVQGYDALSAALPAADLPRGSPSGCTILSNGPSRDNDVRPDVLSLARWY
jgi:hypothetical protein